MTKPTRSEFARQVVDRYPGAICVEADRGLKILVGAEGVGIAIETLAQAAALTVQGVDLVGTEQVMVRVFGFPRKKVNA